MAKFDLINLYVETYHQISGSGAQNHRAVAAAATADRVKVAALSVSRNENSPDVPTLVAGEVVAGVTYLAKPVCMVMVSPILMSWELG